MHEHATQVGASNHILQRIVPFECTTFSLPVLSLRQNEARILDGYFQLFHLDALQSLELSSIKLTLVLAGRGRAKITVFHSCGPGLQKPLITSAVQLDSAPHLTFSIDRADLAGILFIELTASTDVTIEAAQWCIDARHVPAKQVHLGIASCTFNRQNEIVKTIESVHSCEAFKSGNLDIFIIDNGSNLELPAALKNPHTHLIAQRNLGGAGGFTRGVIELAGLQQVTHILLMDDDIELLPEVVDRVVRWLAIMPTNTALSGAMLDGVQRTLLYEAGARFLPHTFEVAPNFHKIALEPSSDSIQTLSKPSAPDYGAWWFFAFSREALEAAGLPLPIFIRGDDIEFGVRLKKLGFKTQVVHGLAVWHEPFYMKRSIWPMYYAIRNFTLINGVHFKTPAAAYILTVTKMFVQFVLRMDYGAGAAIQQGLADYLKGPKNLLRAGDENHTSVMKYLAGFAIKSLSANQAALLDPEVLPASSGTSKILQFLTVGRHLLPFRASRPQVFTDDYISWRWIRRDSYLQTHAISKQSQLFIKSPAKFWSLSWKMALTLLKAVVLFNRRSQQYRDEFKNLTSEKTWRKYLDMPPAADT